MVFCSDAHKSLILLGFSKSSVSPLIPRRSKVRFAPTSFYARGKKDVIRPAPLLLLSKSQPLALGRDLILGANLEPGASILLRCSMTSVLIAFEKL